MFPSHDLDSPLSIVNVPPSDSKPSQRKPDILIDIDGITGDGTMEARLIQIIYDYGRILGEQLNALSSEDSSNQLLMSDIKTDVLEDRPVDKNSLIIKDLIYVNAAIRANINPVFWRACEGRSLSGMIEFLYRNWVENGMRTLSYGTVYNLLVKDGYVNHSVIRAVPYITETVTGREDARKEQQNKREPKSKDSVPSAGSDDTKSTSVSLDS